MLTNLTRWEPAREMMAVHISNTKCKDVFEGKSKAELLVSLMDVDGEKIWM
jgi:hypothetical protein